jgi:hypothetical protein
MTYSDHSQDEDVLIYRRLSPEGAARLRDVMTILGAPPHCFIKGCRRERRCTTRQVLCWQIAPHELEPHVMLVFARQWQMSVAAGNADDWAPSDVAMLQRVLADFEEGNWPGGGGTR